MNNSRHTGGCACGRVRFVVHGPLGDVVACHCETCRRTSGHYWAATRVPWAHLVIEPSTALAWYRSSTIASRGFCRECGSGLFFRKQAAADVSIAPGALDDASALSMTAHICTAEAGAYYPLPADVPCYPGPSMDDSAG